MDRTLSAMRDIIGDRSFDIESVLSVSREQLLGSIGSPRDGEERHTIILLVLACLRLQEFRHLELLLGAMIFDRESGEKPIQDPVVHSSVSVNVGLLGLEVADRLKAVLVDIGILRRRIGKSRIRIAGDSWLIKIIADSIKLFSEQKHVPQGPPTLRNVLLDIYSGDFSTKKFDSPFSDLEARLFGSWLDPRRAGPRGGLKRDDFLVLMVLVLSSKTYVNDILLKLVDAYVYEGSGQRRNPLQHTIEFLAIRAEVLFGGTAALNWERIVEIGVHIVHRDTDTLEVRGEPNSVALVRDMLALIYDVVLGKRKIDGLAFGGTVEVKGQSDALQENVENANPEAVDVPPAPQPLSVVRVRETAQGYDLANPDYSTDEMNDPLNRETFDHLQSLIRDLDGPMAGLLNSHPQLAATFGKYRKHLGRSIKEANIVGLFLVGTALAEQILALEPSRIIGTMTEPVEAAIIADLRSAIVSHKGLIAGFSAGRAMLKRVADYNESGADPKASVARSKPILEGMSQVPGLLADLAGGIADSLVRAIVLNPVTLLTVVAAEEFIRSALLAFGETIRKHKAAATGVSTAIYGFSDTKPVKLLWLASKYLYVYSDILIAGVASDAVTRIYVEWMIVNAASIVQKGMAKSDRPGEQ